MEIFPLNSVSTLNISSFSSYSFLMFSHAQVIKSVGTFDILHRYLLSQIHFLHFMLTQSAVLPVSHRYLALDFLPSASQCKPPYRFSSLNQQPLYCPSSLLQSPGSKPIPHILSFCYAGLHFQVSKSVSYIYY